MVFQVPSDDDKPRFVCEGCGYIDYDNPRIVVGTLPLKAGKVLLCRRAIEPRKGYWTTPSGFMENDESLEQGALRETLEETGCRVRLDRLHVVCSVPRVHQVYMLFLAHWEAQECAHGFETEEVRFFEFDAIPWDRIAFAAVTKALEAYISKSTGVVLETID